MSVQQESASVDEATLVLRVLEGNRSAFGELYDRRARLIRAVCFDHTRDLETAADLTQEAFLRAFRNLGKLDPPERFGAWLVGIARRVCHEWRRTELRERRRLRNVRVHATDCSDSLCAADNSPACERLLTAVAQLPDKERLALHVFYLQGHLRVETVP